MTDMTMPDNTINVSQTTYTMMSLKELEDLQETMKIRRTLWLIPATIARIIVWGAIAAYIGYILVLMGYPQAYEEADAWGLLISFFALPTALFVVVFVLRLLIDQYREANSMRAYLSNIIDTKKRKAAAEEALAASA